MPSNSEHILIADQTRVLAEATVSSATSRTVHADLRVEAGHLPAGTRTRLVDAVIDAVRWSGSGSQLEVTLPAGDGEMLDRLRHRCGGQLQIRTAGASCLATGAIRNAPLTEGP